MSLSQSAVANKLRLLKLSYEEQRLIVENGLTERHARALLKVEAQEVRIDIIKHISSLKLNVANTEQYVEKVLKMLKNAENQPNSEEKTAINEDDKQLNDLISNFKRKIDTLKKLGKDATISVLEGESAVDVHIVIAK